MCEARTQDAFAAIVNVAPETNVRVLRVYLAFRYKHYGFVVKEYIEGRDCALHESKRVAPAIAQLNAIRAPTTVPGPVRGGFVSNAIFQGIQTCVPYESVHIYKILSKMGYPRTKRIDFTAEEAELYLCRRPPPREFPSQHERRVVCHRLRGDLLSTARVPVLRIYFQPRLPVFLEDRLCLELSRATAMVDVGHSGDSLRAIR
ncbi:hypothetical protein C8Q80DRAFT_1184460 [Daedaleopsis nitida]|nr:hypothetical protein C8Q80DRAFT_1184460 [Daedaleopsis nitida]